MTTLSYGQPLRIQDILVRSRILINDLIELLIKVPEWMLRVG